MWEGEFSLGQINKNLVKKFALLNKQHFGYLLYRTFVHSEKRELKLPKPLQVGPLSIKRTTSLFCQTADLRCIQVSEESVRIYGL